MKHLSKVKQMISPIVGVLNKSVMLFVTSTLVVLFVLFVQHSWKMATILALVFVLVRVTVSAATGWVEAKGLYKDTSAASLKEAHKHIFVVPRPIFLILAAVELALILICVNVTWFVNAPTYASVYDVCSTMFDKDDQNVIDVSCVVRGMPSCLTSVLISTSYASITLNGMIESVSDLDVNTLDELKQKDEERYNKIVSDASVVENSLNQVLASAKAQSLVTVIAWLLLGCVHYPASIVCKYLYLKRRETRGNKCVQK